MTACVKARIFVDAIDGSTNERRSVPSQFQDQAAPTETHDSTGLMGFSKVLLVRSHQERPRFAQRNRMIQRIKEMLLVGRRQVTCFFIHLDRRAHSQLQGVQQRHGLAGSVRVQSHRDRRHLRQPMWRLENRDLRLLDELEKAKSLKGMRLFGPIRKNPLHNDAGVQHDRRHGLPALRAARTAFSVTRRVRFRNANNLSTALARRWRRRRSSIARRIKSVNTALLFCRPKALSNACFTSGGTLKFTVAISPSGC